MPERENDREIGPDLARGLSMPRMSRMSRRGFLTAGGMAALGLGLSACSIPGATGSKLGLSAARAEIDKFWADAKKTPGFRFANWPLYIDVSDSNPNDHPSLDLFTKETGIKVTYSEPITGVDTYFGKIQPILAAHGDIGADLIVITNGRYLEKMIQLDYLLPLDQDAMPNFYANASPLVLDPSFDRGNVYTMAWQSGITGIGYDPKRVGHKITSWNDLQDPKLKGKIGMFGDTEDLPNSALCAIGVNPENSTPDDWQKAADWLKKQRPLVRKYYTQDYVGPLSKGDIWASQAWSGDIFQANASGASLEFVVPEEGAPIWTDNMCMPAYAKNPRDAMIYMDFVYRPDVAAMLAAWINYITPVPAVQEVFLKDAADAKSADDKAMYKDLADSPLIFPAPDDYKKLHRYRVLTPAEQQVWDQLFEPIYQS